VELGLFKAETAEIEHIFESAEKLPQVASFKKRGQRRQSAFVNQPFYNQIITTAEIDFSLPASEISFWKEFIR